MKIKEIKNKEVWEGFLMDFENKTFLQSWNWGEFQALIGKKIWRLAVYNDGELAGICLMYKEEAKRGRHLVIPHGPVIKPGFKIKGLQDSTPRPEILNALMREVKKIAREEGVSFIRVAPIWERARKNREIFEQAGLRQAPMHIHAEVSWQINIDRPEKEILARMRKNTRYYIRKAERNPDIQIKKGFAPEDLAVFQQLYAATVSRHNFTAFSEQYLRNEIKAFQSDGEAMIFIGKFKNKPFVSAIIIFWQNIAFYHHGASLPCHEPVSYAVQWEIIKEAKARGCRLYNLWGITDIERRSHPWAGLTRFKKGFGGKATHYVKTMDLPMSRFYWFNYGIESIRRIKRGF